MPNKRFQMNSRIRSLAHYCAALVLLLVLSHLSVLAQTQEPAKPGPEIKKMGVFVGKWKLVEEDEATPFGPGGTSILETEIRFVHNGFFMEAQGKGKDPSKTPYTYTILYSYDAAAKTYRSFFYNSEGGVLQTVGNFDGNTWTDQWTQESQGKTYKCKGVATVAADGKKRTDVWS